MIAKDCAKTKAMIIAVNILGALEGFLPKAVMLENVPAAKTAHGPSIQRQKIMTSERLRLIPYNPFLSMPLGIYFITLIIFLQLLS